MEMERSGCGFLFSLRLCPFASRVLLFVIYCVFVPVRQFTLALFIASLLLGLKYDERREKRHTTKSTARQQQLQQQRQWQCLGVGCLWKIRSRPMGNVHFIASIINAETRFRKSHGTLVLPQESRASTVGYKSMVTHVPFSSQQNSRPLSRLQEYLSSNVSHTLYLNVCLRLFRQPATSRADVTMHISVGGLPGSDGGTRLDLPAGESAGFSCTPALGWRLSFEACRSYITRRNLSANHELQPASPTALIRRSLQGSWAKERKTGRCQASTHPVPVTRCL